MDTQPAAPAVTGVKRVADDPLSSYYASNDKYLWRNALVKGRIEQIKVEQQPVPGGSDHMECKIKLTEGTDGRLRYILPPMVFVDGCLNGNGVISARSNDKHVATSNFYAILSKKGFSEDFLKKNPNAEKDAEDCLEMLANMEKHVITAMCATGKIKTDKLGMCMVSAAQDLQKSGVDISDMNSEHPELKKAVVKHYLQGANAMFNPKKVDIKPGENKAAINLGDLLKKNSADNYKPDSVTVTANAWTVKKGEKIAEHKLKFNKILEDSKNPTPTPEILHKYMLEAGFQYKPMNIFMEGDTVPLVSKVLSACDAALWKLRAAKKAKGTFDEKEFDELVKKERQRAMSAFNDYVTKGSIVKVEIYPEAYANKGTESPYGVRIKMTGKITILEQGTANFASAPITSDKYTVDTDKLFTNILGKLDFGGAYNAEFDKRANEEEDEHDKKLFFGAPPQPDTQQPQSDATPESKQVASDIKSELEKELAGLASDSKDEHPTPKKRIIKKTGN